MFGVWREGPGSTRIEHLMRSAPMHVELHHAAEELDSLTHQLPRAAIWRRLRAVTLAQAGGTAEAIAASLVCTAGASRSGSPASTAARPMTWPTMAFTN